MELVVVQPRAAWKRGRKLSSVQRREDTFLETFFIKHGRLLLKTDRNQFSPAAGRDMYTCDTF